MHAATRAAAVVALNAAILPLALPPVPSSAQTVRIFTATPNDLKESYDEAAKVSGSPIVGLRFEFAASEDENSRVDPDDLMIYWPAGGQSNLCVRTVTQDGRFSATGNYTVADNGTGGYALLDPATEDFARELGGYRRSELAVRAFVSKGPECPVSGAVHLPLAAAPLPEGEANAPRAPEQLVVLVNARSQHGSARLVAADGTTPYAEAECERTGASSLIAFDTACRLTLGADLSGTAQLVVTLNDGFSDTEYRIAVAVPGAPS